MNVSLYQAASALEANLMRQQTISENLAASSVPGFKRRDMSFNAVSAGMFPGALDEANKTQLQYLMPSYHQSTNFSQGTLMPTGSNTDVAIDGPGFFAVQGANGQTMYTRDGSFRTNSEGVLSTADGRPLLGVNGPITANTQSADPISISDNGDVSQGGLALGKLQVVSFSNPDQLQRLSAGYFGAGSQAPQAADPNATSVRQGFLEGANTTPMHEMSQLMQTLRHFEANQKMMTVQDERLGKIIQELSNTN